MFGWLAGEEMWHLNGISFIFFTDISELGCLIHRLEARVLDEAVLTNRNKVF